MEGLMQPKALRERIMGWADEEIRYRNLPPRAVGGIDPASIPPLKWTIKNFLLCGEVTLLGGMGGVGKSLNDKSFALAALHSLLGNLNKPFKVLFFLCEH